MKRILGCLWAGIFLAGHASGQTLLNGSFESNTGSCQYNISNATFNAGVSNTVAFGIASQLDIISTACGFGSAQQGSWFVAMAVDISNTQNDAFSMRLNTPLVNGASYTLSWYDRGWSPYVTNVLEVGISNASNSFGTSLFTTPLPTIGTWVARSVTFTAPSAGLQFVTARVLVGSYGWTHVDNFVVGVPLPVDALSLYGTPQAEGDLLQWEAHGETAVAGYTVEYLPAQGSPRASARVLATLDGQPYAHMSTLAQGAPYPRQYRLRIHDLNGAESLSNVITVDHAPTAAAAALEVFPNPSQGEFSVRMTDPTIPMSQARIRVYDLRGALLHELPGADVVEVSLHDQAAGMYVVQVVLPSGVWSKRVWLE